VSPVLCGKIILAQDHRATSQPHNISHNVKTDFRALNFLLHPIHGLQCLIRLVRLSRRQPMNRNILSAECVNLRAFELPCWDPVLKKNIQFSIGPVFGFRSRKIHQTMHSSVIPAQNSPSIAPQFHANGLSCSGRSELLRMLQRL
jgi:hypothetical protein